jgi:hypothetical protein
LDKDLTAYAQAEVRLAGAFNGLHREIVNLSEKLGDAFPVGIGDENRYNFAGDGEYSTLAEWVHGKAGLGRRAAGRAGVLFAVAIGAYSAVEAARELAGGKSFMAAMQNVTDPITSRVVQGLTIPSAAASDAAHSILEKTGVIQPARIATGTPAGQVGVPAARGLPADGTQAGRTVVV